MSVRAYKIIEIKTEPQPTFNVWHDDKILKLADQCNLDSDGGILYFHTDDIITAIENDPKDDPDYTAVLQQILKDAGDRDTVEYYCY